MKKRIQRLLQRIRKKDIYATLELGSIKDPNAIEPLMEALGDENEWVRNYVSLCLYGMNNPIVTELLANNLEKSNDSRKLHILETLTMIADPSCLKKVKLLLSDPNPIIKEKSKLLINKIIQQS